MYPFSNYTYVSFPDLILFRLANYLLELIYDFTVSGLLKIKLIGSVYFHRVCPKILVFRPLSSRLAPFFLVQGHVINHLKQKFCVLSIAQKRSFLSQVKGRNDHKIFMDVDFVSRLKSGFSSGYSKISRLKNTAIQGTI